jgi:hypothetical protein
MTASTSFHDSLTPLRSFARLADPAVYAPLPEDWVLGLSDIVSSTAAIEVGRYKTVNTAAAAVIAAVSNALGQDDFPFAFAGDGASFALPADQAHLGRGALAAVIRWVHDELDLTMRAALVPIEKVREAGFDVRVARFAPSPDVAYAMFSGGGLAWAEGRMKAGDFSIEPAPAGVRPNLTGLSCRFEELRSTRGVILSLIVIPDPAGDPARFGEFVRAILRLAEGEEVGSPVPVGGPPPYWPPSGLELEVRASALYQRSRLAARLWVGVITLAAHTIFKTGLRVGGFDPARYVQQLVRNTDFRKFDDGLRMTLDCTPALADRIDALLARGEESGIARCGTHRQDAALMTCFVPSPTRSDHVHFVDGASGGYAAAARALKMWD